MSSMSDLDVQIREAVAKAVAGDSTKLEALQAEYGELVSHDVVAVYVADAVKGAN